MRSVAISVVVHGALLAVVSAYEPPARDDLDAPVTIPIEIVPPEPPPPPALPQPEPSPIDVAIPDEPRPAPVRAPTRVATAAPAPAIEQPTAPPTVEPPRRTSYFDMRSREPARVDLRLPAHFRGDLERVPAGTAPETGPRPTGQLQEAGGGTYRSEQGAFTARVDRDGGVTLKDNQNFRFKLALPSAKQIGRGISDWYYSDKGADGKRGTRALEKDVSGSIDGEDRSRAAIVPVFRGGFDITDAFMRGKGNDPYAAAKLRYLDSTRDERVAIGKQHRAEQLARVHHTVQRNLARLWAQTPALADRKRALFEVWDECVETGDDLVLEASRAARRLVVGFIRGHLPAGGPDAYTADELAALNAGKQSTATFAPYD